MMVIVPSFLNKTPSFFALVLGIFIVFGAQAAQQTMTFYGDSNEPALYHQRQAELNSSPIRQDFLIKQAISHMQHAEFAHASAVIDTLFSESLTTKQISQTKLIQAHLALLRQQPQKTLDIIYTLPPYLPYDLMVMQQDLLAQAYADLGETILSIEQRLLLDSRLKEHAEKQRNALATWETVLQIPASQILAIHNASSNPALKAWLALAHIKAEYVEANPTALTSLRESLEQWKQTYPDHPGLAASGLETQLLEGLQAVAAPKTDANKSRFHFTNPLSAFGHASPAKPKTKPNIVVLLPKSGDYAYSAKAIELGIMHAFYQDPDDVRPTVHFMDSSQHPRAVYQRALNKGADIIIGPLAKKNVLEVYRGKQFPVLTLALNDLPFNSQRYRPENFYQFSLSTEDEAEQVAIRAYQDNRANALVIRSSKDWGQKLDEAFSAHFEQLGGSIRERLLLRDGEDPAPKVKKLLQFEENPKPIRVVSEQQVEHPTAPEALPENMASYTNEAGEIVILNTDTGEIIEKHAADQAAMSEAAAHSDEADSTEENTVKEILIHHRTDVDMIFLALSAAQAQRVIPLLKFYYANDIPVYTTSIINSTHVDESQDFDGALFCDMPWILNKTYQAGQLRSALAKRWPNSTTSQPRLFAFGVDAYHIARDLYQIQPTLVQGLQGHTGLLSLVQGNRVYRQLPWAQYNNGRAVLLDDVRVQ